eukprot:GHVN01034970.1.p2 GENE.GHVN01034970.1~~GHVN01034970.1.p2  ORF type:complete len:173 (-),score=36.57 GHVN01034970.1:1448-1966(-)
MTTSPTTATPAAEDEPKAKDSPAKVHLVDDGTGKPISVPATLAQKERLEARKKRFGVQSVEEKLEARKNRFSSTTSVTAAVDDEERKKQRAEKFGILTPGNEESKRKTRAERFGVTHPQIEEEKKAQRKERFSATPANKPISTSSTSWECDPALTELSAEERRKLRAARFKS